MELILDVQGRADKPILHCRGNIICGHEAEALQAAISRLLTVAEHVTLDLRDVRKMDCAGLGAIVAGSSLARQRGKTLELRSVPSQIRQMIRATGLLGYLNETEQPFSPSVGAFAA